MLSRTFIANYTDVPTPPIPTTSSYILDLGSQTRRARTDSDILAESYFSGVAPSSPPNLAAAGNMSFTASPDACLYPEFDFSAFLESSLPTPDIQLTSYFDIPPFLSEPQSPAQTINLFDFDFDTGTSPKDILGAISEGGSLSGIWGRTEAVW